jgi:transcriptional regulator with XRE-family HTH domain
MSKTKTTLGDRIKQLRNNLDLSQQDLADKIKVSKAQINRTTSGRCTK